MHFIMASFIVDHYDVIFSEILTRKPDDERDMCLFRLTFQLCNGGVYMCI